MPKGIFQRTEETKRKIGEGNKKRYIKYPELKKKIAEKLKGRKLSEETKKKMSLTKKGRYTRLPFSEEWRRNMSKAKIKNPVKYWLGKRFEKSPNWRGGISFEPYSIDWTETLKKAIRERDHYICSLCSQYGNVVHHRDYDKKNSNPDNLINLCVGCNSKVNKNRNYWLNYFKRSLK